MNRDLTKGPIVKSMLLFAVPMILGDLLQQCYNIVDTLIVGHWLGRNALAASTENMLPKLEEAVILMYFIMLA